MRDAVIWKFALNPTTGGQYAMPPGARFLALQVQDETPVMWWAVPNPQPPPRDWLLRTFTVIPTGGPGYTDTLHYVGTFQLGAFVGHVMAWEEVERDA